MTMNSKKNSFIRKDQGPRPENPLLRTLRQYGLTNNEIRAATRQRGPFLRPPIKIENMYKKELRFLVREWRELYLEMVDLQLEYLYEQSITLKPNESSNVKTDSWVDDLDEILKGYTVALDNTINNIDITTRQIGEVTNDFNLAQWRKLVDNAFGINIFVNEPWLEDQLKSFTKQNSTLIKKLSEETRADIERIIRDGFQRGKRVEAIRKEILSNTRLKPGRFRKTRTRADLIAVDQVNKLNGQLSQLRQNDIGVDMYIWRTSKDERVRSSHAEMEGKLCRWDDATVYSDDGGKTWKKRSSIGGVELHPGQDYRCRCYPEPFFGSLFSVKGQKRKIEGKSLQSKKTRKKTITPKPLKFGTFKEDQLKDFEKRVVNNRYETLGFFDRNGNNILELKGSKSSVQIPDNKTDLLRYGTAKLLTHNHPGGNSFSSADIRLSLYWNLREMRAVGKKYTHSFEIIKAIPVDKRKEALDTFDKAYEKAQRKVRRKFSNKIDKKEVTIEKAQSNHFHEVAKLYTAELKKKGFGVQYKRRVTK